MPMDIFPRIDIPVVTVIWSFGGLSPTEMVSHLREAVDASRDYLRVAQVQYRNGVVDYLVVFDAERTLLGNQLALARAENLQLIASIRLIKALGGGWQSVPS